ncbi:cytochrome c1 [Thalassobius sp. I31.1]|uniref:cytochrome c1 n=1 Tax=Thalassobius sp. I31.1 TaxID=2109912 RepID=UPI000D1A4FF8|nr:cytochrome c1 [Thalassobius sp. I31.1]
MMKKLLISAALTLGLTSGAMAAGGGEQAITDYEFSFEGPFGTFDRDQLQRGLQVYTEVCSACHGLQYLYFRNLADEGGPAYTGDQARAYAETIQIYDPEIDDYRAATPADKFPENTGAGAPDLTLMAKARAGFHGPAGLGINQIVYGMGGAEYIASLLTHYNGHDEESNGNFLYGNDTFAGGLISMAPPLSDDIVEYADGTPATVEQMAKDVSAFLMWTAEPKMMARKQVGFVGVAFLVLLSVLLYLTNKRLWAPVKGKKLHGDA